MRELMNYCENKKLKLLIYLLLMFAPALFGCIAILLKSNFGVLMPGWLVYAVIISSLFGCSCIVFMSKRLIMEKILIIASIIFVIIFEIIIVGAIALSMDGLSGIQ